MSFFFKTEVDSTGKGRDGERALPAEILQQLWRVAATSEFGRLVDLLGAMHEMAARGQPSADADSDGSDSSSSSSSSWSGGIEGSHPTLGGDTSTDDSDPPADDSTAGPRSPRSAAAADTQLRLDARYDAAPRSVQTPDPPAPSPPDRPAAATAAARGRDFENRVLELARRATGHPDSVVARPRVPGSSGRPDVHVSGTSRHRSAVIDAIYRRPNTTHAPRDAAKRLAEQRRALNADVAVIVMSRDVNISPATRAIVREHGVHILHEESGVVEGLRQLLRRGTGSSGSGGSSSGSSGGGSSSSSSSSGGRVGHESAGGDDRGIITDSDPVAWRTRGSRHLSPAEIAHRRAQAERYPGGKTSEMFEIYVRNTLHDAVDSLAARTGAARALVREQHRVPGDSAEGRRTQIVDLVVDASPTNRSAVIDAKRYLRTRASRENVKQVVAYRQALAADVAILVYSEETNIPHGVRRAAADANVVILVEGDSLMDDLRAALAPHRRHQRAGDA